MHKGVRSKVKSVNDGRRTNHEQEIRVADSKRFENEEDFRNNFVLNLNRKLERMLRYFI